MKDTRKYIKIRGANVHNLKNISLDIPRDSFTVLTGLSGSGKSSLAFGVLVFVFPPVFGSDGKAGCGENRRFAAGNFNRPEIDQSQPAFNGGNGDGNI